MIEVTLKGDAIKGRLTIRSHPDGGRKWMVERNGSQPMGLEADTIGEAINTAIISQHQMQPDQTWLRMREVRSEAASKRAKERIANGTFGRQSTPTANGAGGAAASDSGEAGGGGNVPSQHGAKDTGPASRSGKRVNQSSGPATVS